MNTARMRAASLIVALSLATVFGSSVLAAEPTPELRLPPDVTYGGAKGSPGPVVFRHATHVAFSGNKCTGCHPGLFPMLGSQPLITHAEMNAGKSCGTCHDGKKASGVQNDCLHCHKIGGGP